MFLLACVWWYRKQEIEPVIAAIGYLVAFAQTFRPPADPGELKQRDLTIRQKLRDAFPRSDAPWDVTLRRRSEKWESPQLIIRSLADRTYPGGNQPITRGVPSWFGSELYDFYHNGIKIFRDIIVVAFADDGSWAIVDEKRKDSYLEPYHVGKAYRVGCIPFRDIAEVDPDGDEFYPTPQIHCRYAENGTPFEEEDFVLIGPDRDDPLDEAKRFELES